jgi:hypothetical protein
MRASLVLQRVEFTTVAEYPASAVQMAISRMAVVLRLCKTTPAVGSRIPKKVAYVQSVIEFPKREFLHHSISTFLFDTQ